MILRIAVSIIIFAYGLMFLHLAVFTLVKRKGDFNGLIHSATAGVFSLLCLSGAAGIYIDAPAAGFYITAFVLFSLLAPLGTAYALEYLGDDRTRLFLRPVLALTGAVIIIGLASGIAGLHWRKVVCMAYALIALSLGTVGVFQFRQLDPYPKLPGQLRIFVAFYWFIILQVTLMLVFQFLELIPVVHVLWLICNITILILNLIVETDAGGAKRISELAAAVRYKKSRLQSVDVQERLSRLDRVMAKERLFASPELKIVDVAARLKMTGPQLSELLNRHRGQNFTSFINQLRIELAKERLIAAPGSSILDIGFDCGFSSKSAFNAAFRKQTGLTPNEFRARGLES